MRQKKVWRYYCDHCNKGGCGKAAMIKHEGSCCHSPVRVCRMCWHGELCQQPMPDLLAALEEGGVEKLREVADGCPACMLAAVIQFPKDPGEGPWFDFDFKKESVPFWEAVNDANRGPY